MVRILIRARAGLLLTLLLLSCAPTPPAIVTRTCSGCHNLPAPRDLYRESWPYVLAYMGLFSGIRDTRGLSPAEVRQWQNRQELLTYLNKIPAPALSDADWNRIREWYLESASTSPVAPRKRPELPGLFSAEPFAAIHDPGISALLVNNQSVWVAQGFASRITEYNQRGEALAGFMSQSPVVHFSPIRESILVTEIGDLLGNSPGVATGRVYRWARAQQPLPIAGSLPRPTMAIPYQDGWLVPTFGLYDDSGIFLLGPGPTRRIAAGNGAVAVAPYGRGFFALYANALEKLSYFAELTDDTFTETVMDHYPPSAGGTSMSLAGDLLVVVHGDNADAGPYNRAKPGQGVTIYDINKEANTPRIAKRFHFPLPGAYFAVPGDFNADGLTDFAVTAYYGQRDASGRMLAFVLLMGRGTSWEAFTVPGLPEARWSVATTGDIDNDGDTDILLGAANIPVAYPDGIKQFQKLPSDVYLLRNNSKR